MRNLAIIPARSGSKGLINKNIKLLDGRPLLSYSIEAAKLSRCFDEIMVSTDSEEYANIARDYGATVPYLRSEKLSKDNSSSWDVVKDTIRHYQNRGILFDTVTLLQPTSPLRISADIIHGFEMMEKEKANLVVSVCEASHSPLLCNRLPINNSLSNFINQDIVVKPRQALATYYRINGALYIIKVAHLLNVDDIYSDKSFATLMPKERSIDIDDELDFIIAEQLKKYRD